MRIMSPSTTLPIGPPAKAFRADVADARAGGNAGETRVGQQRDLLAERQMFQRAGHLIGFLHARAHRPDARQHQHVAGLDAARP